MTITWEISFGNLLTIASFVIFAAGIIYKVMQLKFRVDLMWHTFSERFDLPTKDEP